MIYQIVPGDVLPARDVSAAAPSPLTEIVPAVRVTRPESEGGKRTLRARQVLALRRAYYASVTQTDYMVGKVIAALEDTSFAPNTVISIWGDHGWQLGACHPAAAGAFVAWPLIVSLSVFLSVCLSVCLSFCLFRRPAHPRH
jgi:arylsulfatase A-like enzyme